MSATPSRESLVHQLYEAAELEHNLMCTYLYAAYSLKGEDAAELSSEEAAFVAGARKTIIAIAIEEMSHLTAVWNITAALGATPRFGRGNFPLDPGYLPAGIVVKLAPFCEASLQHFIFLERPVGSSEPEGAGFEPEFRFERGVSAPRLTPMAVDYETVGAFYAALSADLTSFVAQVGEANAFAGDPALQLSAREIGALAIQPVRCLKTALAAFEAIVQQGEGASADSVTSHYQRFVALRSTLSDLKAKNPSFEPALPAPCNPVLRRPLRATGRVWISEERAARVVDLANTSYALMLRLVAYAYTLPSPSAEKALAVQLGLGLMRAMTHWGEYATRLPAAAGDSESNAGMSFTALRDTAPLLPGPSAWRFFVERFLAMQEVADTLVTPEQPRTIQAVRILADLTAKAQRGLAARQESSKTMAISAPPSPGSNSGATQPSMAVPVTSGGIPIPTVIDGVEHIRGKSLTLLFEAKKCIHARFCVTGAPSVFLANVQGPWINPDAIAPERLIEIAHACPSGAIRYERTDGKPEEPLPPVNLIAIREAGPYAVRGQLEIDGQAVGTRATLCRCGASKNKPYCDGSHHDAPFTASGEPPTGKADMLAQRDGVLGIEPQLDGPLQVRGNLEITSGTGRVVARVEGAYLCRCGASGNKPFCDGSHARVGFKSS